MIEDIFKQTNKNIEMYNIKTHDDLHNHNNFIVSFSPSMISKSKDIKSFLFNNVYNHNNLLNKRENVEKIILNLFKYFYKSPNKLPNDWHNKNEPIELQNQLSSQPVQAGVGGTSTFTYILLGVGVLATIGIVVYMNMKKKPQPIVVKK